MDVLISFSVYFQVAPRIYEVALALRDSKRISDIRSTSNKNSILRSILSEITYHAKTIYLLTCSDLKTIVLPWILFAVAHAVATAHFNIPPSQTTTQLLSRLPLAILSIILNLICFNISNQRSQSSIAQDAVNKPWRPYVSKRLDPAKSGDLLIMCTFATYWISSFIGGKYASMTITMLTYLYNDCGGSEHFLTRDPLNGAGILMFGIAATEALLGTSEDALYSSNLVSWWLVLFVITTAGIHVPDHQDFEGDAAEGRKTFIIMFGQAISRWTVALAALASSIWAPCHLGLPLYVAIPSLVMALYVSRRTITKTDIKSDKKTYKVWGLWLTMIYTLPLFTLWC